MTARAAFTRIFKEGRQLIQSAVFKTQKKAGVKVGRLVQQKARWTEQLKNDHPWQHQWRSVWNRAVNGAYYRTLASELRRRAAWNGGGRSPLVAFMGLALAQSYQQENEEIVSSISEFIKNHQERGQGSSSLLEKVQSLSLDKFQFGAQIGQGCNAAVYEARIKPDLLRAEYDSSDTDSEVTVLDTDSEFSEEEEELAPTEFPALVAMETGFAVAPDNHFELVEEDRESEASFCVIKMEEETQDQATEPAQQQGTEPDCDSSPQFDLAVKMMFNYSDESNASAIIREMEKETVPARLAQAREQMEPWENGNRVRKKCLPPHPNVVDMLGVFVDPMPQLPEALENYPAALPRRLNPEGIGRNNTMFVVMKRYDMTLRQYLADSQPSFRERLILLAQLLEAVVHLGNHGIAHRDMKSDNIFLSCSAGGAPKLVLGDFGCCLADSKHGMKLPYPVDEIDKGGNTALMAPEIVCTQPGRFSVLNYTKADLWGVGALAYEILGLENPFYSAQAGKCHLNSRTYQSTELPPLPDTSPPVLKRLIQSLLDRNPRKRPSAVVAANVVHLLLWWPPHLLLPGNAIERSDVNWYLAVMATELLFKGVLRQSSETECQLKAGFLQRLNLNALHAALTFVNQ